MNEQPEPQSLEEIVDAALGFDEQSREFADVLHADYVRQCEEAERLPYDEKVKRIAELWQAYIRKVQSLFEWSRKKPEGG